MTKALAELNRFAFASFRPPKKQTVSEWADENRILSTDYSAEPGRWKTSRAPYQREIMDSFTQPGIWQIVVMASAQVGKALDIETPISTKDGWKTMADICVGDVVFDEYGDECNVTAVSPIWEDRPCYCLLFSDGSKIVADEEHLWTMDKNAVLRNTFSTLEVWSDFKLHRCVFVLPERRRRHLLDIYEVEPRRTRCIEVDSKSHLYRAGKSLIPTHNSEIELNMMGCAIDNDPGPILYIQPTESMAEDYSKRRIAPMIQACPTMRDKVFKAKGRDAANTITMKTFPGGSLAIIGANSPAELASRPVRYIFMDETDRFPASAGTEGDPQELAERRTETFRHNRKIVKTSTPTIKGISKIEADYMSGTQEEWHTECPYCHTYNLIRFTDIKFDREQFKNEYGDEDYKVKHVSWQCPVCKREIPEHDAKRLPAKWVSKNPKAIDNGIRSFRLNAFMSPWSDWKDIVRKFLRAHKDPEKLKVVYNTIFGETWEVHTNNGLEEQLYRRREHYDSEVPTGVLLLTMGIDTQDNRLEYEVVGWDRHGQSWGINRGIIPGRADAQGVWDEVDDLLDREWKLQNGLKLRILATFVDSGGHFTHEVYEECSKRKTKRIWAIKGEGGEGKQYVRQMKRSTGETDGIKFIVGVDCGKEGIMYEAGITEPGAGYMHFPKDGRAGYDMNYFRGLISEHMVMHRRNGRSVVAWEKIYERNEPLDCRNYARACYRFFNWNFDKLERIIKGEDDEINFITRSEENKRKERHIVSRGIQI